jgi:hypothetical protein
MDAHSVPSFDVAAFSDLGHGSFPRQEEAFSAKSERIAVRKETSVSPNIDSRRRVALAFSLPGSVMPISGVGPESHSMLRVRSSG